MSGKKINKPDNPIKENKTFVDWYTDSNFEEKFDFNQEIYEDITLYAKFK